MLSTWPSLLFTIAVFPGATFRRPLRPRLVNKHSMESKSASFALCLKTAGQPYHILSPLYADMVIWQQIWMIREPHYSRDGAGSCDKNITALCGQQKAGIWNA